MITFCYLCKKEIKIGQNLIFENKKTRTELRKKKTVKAIIDNEGNIVCSECYNPKIDTKKKGKRK